MYKRSGLVIITAIIVIVVCFPLLFIPWDSTDHSRSLTSLWNLGHLPLFACIGILLLNTTERYTAISYEGQLFITIFAALSIGFIIEVAQYFLGRFFSFYDLYLDVLGAAFIVIWFPKKKTIRNKISPKLCKLVSVIAILFSLMPLMLELTDEFLARKQFPVLADFQSPLELDRFSGNARLVQGNGELKVQFGTEKYAGFILEYFPRDWRDYKYVSLDIDNTNQEKITLICRIHDFTHDASDNDRFKQQFTIKPGTQVINIDLDEVKSAPQSRSMNMERISKLGCFTIARTSPISLLIKQIALR